MGAKRQKSKKRSNTSTLSEKQLKRTTFFLERSFGGTLVLEELRNAGLKVEPHQARFRHNTPDTEWLAVVGEKKWIVLMRDQNIGRRPLELEGLASNRREYSCYHAAMILSFRDEGTEDIFDGENTKAARKTCPQSLWKVAGRKLDQLDSVIGLNELRIPPGNQLESLSGNRGGQHSIRINDQYRICFTWTETGPEQAEIVDYH